MGRCWVSPSLASYFSLVNWRGLFYITVPIGIFGTIWAYKRLREVSVKDPAKKMDWLGFALLSSGLTLILLGVTYLSYGFSSVSEAIGLLLSGAVLLLLFARVELTAVSPLVDFHLFKIRVLVAGNIAQTLYSACWAGLLLLFALFLEIVLGYTPLQAGIGVIPIEVAYLPSAILAGKISDKYGTRTLTSTGLALGAVGLIILSTFDAGTQYPYVALDLVLIGIGSGLFVTPNSTGRDWFGSAKQKRRRIRSLFYSL